MEDNTINIMPTDEGFERMLFAFEQSIETHRETLREVADIMEKLEEGEFSRENELIYEGLEMIVSDRLTSIKMLEDESAKIREYLRAKGNAIG